MPSPSKEFSDALILDITAISGDAQAWYGTHVDMITPAAVEEFELSEIGAAAGATALNAANGGDNLALRNRVLDIGLSELLHRGHS